MIERFEPTDAHDRRLVPGLDGLLGAFNAAGVLTAADVHTALRLGELVGEDDERLRLGVALAVRAARHGSVCVDLTGIADGDDLPWPDSEGWADDLAASSFAASSVVRVEHGLVYLDRYWREEGQVRDDLVRRAEATPPVVDDAALEAHADRLFPDAGSADQRAVALAAARRGDLLTEEERNTLLASMTDEVAEIVLEDNRLQALAISIAEQGGDAFAHGSK